MSIKNKLVLGYTTLGFFAIFILCMYCYYNAKEALLEEALIHVVNIEAFQKKQSDAFLDDRRRDFKLIVEHNDLKNIYYSIKKSDTILFVNDTIKMKLLNSFISNFGNYLISSTFYNGLIVSRNGKTIRFKIDSINNIFIFQNEKNDDELSQILSSNINKEDRILTTNYAEELFIYSKVEKSDSLEGFAGLIINTNGINRAFSNNQIYAKTFIIIKNIRNKLILGSIVIVIFLFIFIYIISGKNISPLLKLKKNLDKIEKEDFYSQLELNSNDEIGYVIKIINKILKELNTKEVEIIDSKKNLLQLRNKLNEQSLKLSSLYEISIDGIILHDKGKILLVNKTIEKMTGYTVEELLNKKINNLYFQKQQEDKGSLFFYETIALKKGNKSFPVEIIETSIDFNNYTIMVTLVRNIEERGRT
ncbi:MAG: hypothetical protein A2X12_11355 [Bacteroidetes bacterium GWE2_29_8]|nr:MAG: hypothetical protein A2X12_11355 [Bacteroidetes bacterium GWE2_29_8]OFY23066.1 MAG: hypothetical protein A2X02_09560 [Bacteroidetes bacterium GWF2_29_10]